MANGNRKLKSEAKNFPLEILFLRDDDIPQYVEQGVADIGILGQNEVWEKDKKVKQIETLGFASCRLSLAIPKDENYTGLHYFENKKIATSYSKILTNFFKEKNINVTIEEIGGSVEIATSIGLAEAIFDIVSTGSTLLMNGLKEVEVVFKKSSSTHSKSHFIRTKKSHFRKIVIQN
ncbi:ATP phosphoribosyltransferase [Flavobacterium oreochromis]|uniref:ATP phosphoribosyltransferase n=1 Tax=Flavobacterium oreochromis TaxID=2906078 RepID=UPI0035AE6D32